MTLGEWLIGELGPFLGVIALAMLGLIASVPILLLLGRWSEGGSGTEAVLSILGYLLAIAAIMGPTPGHVKLLLAGLILAATLCLPVLSHHLSARSEEDFERQKESQFRAAIALNPGNVAARAYLAESLFRQRRVDEAVEELETAVSLSPSTTQQEARRLAEMKAAGSRLQAPPRPCFACGEENPGTRQVCAFCGAPLTARKELAGAAADTARKLGPEAIWILGGVVLLAAAAGLLPSALGMPITLAAMVAALLWLTRRMRDAA